MRVKVYLQQRWNFQTDRALASINLSVSSPISKGLTQPHFKCAIALWFAFWQICLAVHPPTIFFLCSSFSPTLFPSIPLTPGGGHRHARELTCSQIPPRSGGGCLASFPAVRRLDGNKPGDEFDEPRWHCLEEAEGKGRG